MKKIVVIGASDDKTRNSFTMVKKLVREGYEVYPVGKHSGLILETEILISVPDITDVDIIIMYIRPEFQPEYYDVILKLKPKQIIFNKKTENEELIKIAKENGIETIEKCSLIMLGQGEL